MNKAIVKNQTWGRVLSVEPFVTISKRADFFEQPLGFAPLIPNLAKRGRSVHFLGLCDTLEKTEEADAVARDYREITRQFREALFIFIVSSEIESLHLSMRGIPSFLANELIFVDDNRFKIVREAPEPQFDAVYNAQFYPFKRHHLTQDIGKLLLIYKMSADDSLEQLRRRFPAATFANNLEDTYRRFTPEELSVWYGRSAVGLCLSPSEGAMRVSMEYQLCGLPVVTTPSIGGRDRYFIDDHVRFCPPDRTAVADAVNALRQQSIDPQLIRKRAMRLLSFDRFNFLRAANKVVAQHCGVTQLFRNFAPFRGAPIQPQMLSRVMGSAGQPESKQSAPLGVQNDPSVLM